MMHFKFSIKGTNKKLGQQSAPCLPSRTQHSASLK
uniref:Uncharacterized protein n=1 Tax=Anguilla anguilla TaxID=7936 RepID=A0A0E9QI71_ANGAN